MEDGDGPFAGADPSGPGDAGSVGDYETETCATGSRSRDSEDGGDAMLVVRPEMLYRRQASLQRAKREAREKQRKVLQQQAEQLAVSRRISFTERLPPIDKVGALADVQKTIDVLEAARERQRQARTTAASASKPPAGTTGVPKPKHRPLPGYAPTAVEGAGAWAAINVPEMQFLAPGFASETDDSEGDSRGGSAHAARRRLQGRPGSNTSAQRRRGSAEGRGGEGDPLKGTIAAFEASPRFDGGDDGGGDSDPTAALLACDPRVGAKDTLPPRPASRSGSKTAVHDPRAASAARRVNANALACVVAAVAYARVACVNRVREEEQEQLQQEDHLSMSLSFPLGAGFVGIGGGVLPGLSGRRGSALNSSRRHSRQPPSDAVDLEEAIRNRSRTASRATPGLLAPRSPRGGGGPSTPRSPRSLGAGSPADTPRTHQQRLPQQPQLMSPPAPAGAPAPQIVTPDTPEVAAPAAEEAPAVEPAAPEGAASPIPGGEAKQQQQSRASPGEEKVENAGTAQVPNQPPPAPAATPRLPLTSEALAHCGKACCNIAGWVRSSVVPSPRAAAAFQRALDDEIAAAAAVRPLLRPRTTDSEGGVSRRTSSAGSRGGPFLFHPSLLEDEECNRYMATEMFSYSGSRADGSGGSHGIIVLEAGSQAPPSTPPRTADPHDRRRTASRGSTRHSRSLATPAPLARDPSGAITATIPRVAAEATSAVDTAFGGVKVQELVLRMLRAGKPESWTEGRWQSTLRTMNRTLDEHQRLILEDNDHQAKAVTGTEAELRNLDVETKLRKHLVYGDAADLEALPKLPLDMQKRGSYLALQSQREEAQRAAEEAERRRVREEEARAERQRLELEALKQEEAERLQQLERERLLVEQHQQGNYEPMAFPDDTPGDRGPFRSAPHSRAGSLAAGARGGGGYDVNVDSDEDDAYPFFPASMDARPNTLAPLGASGLSGRAMELHKSPLRKPAPFPRATPHTPALEPKEHAATASRSGSAANTASRHTSARMRRASSRFCLPMVGEAQLIDTALYRSIPYSCPVDALPVANALLNLKARALETRSLSFTGSVREVPLPVVERELLQAGVSPRRGPTAPRLRKDEALRIGVERYGSAMHAKARVHQTCAGGQLFSTEQPTWEEADGGVNAQMVKCTVKQVWLPAYSAAPADMKEFLEERDVAPSECEWRDFDDDEDAAAIAVRAVLADAHKTAEAQRAARMQQHRHTVSRGGVRSRHPAAHKDPQRSPSQPSAISPSGGDAAYADAPDAPLHAVEHGRPCARASLHRESLCVQPCDGEDEVVFAAAAAPATAQPQASCASLLGQSMSTAPVQHPISANGSLQIFLAGQSKSKRNKALPPNRAQPKNGLAQRVHTLRELQATVFEQLSAKKWRAQRSYAS